MASNDPSVMINIGGKVAALPLIKSSRLPKPMKLTI